MDAYAQTMDNVREFNENDPVEVISNDLTHHRLAIRATCESGWAATYVDLQDVLNWVAAHPDILVRLTTEADHAT